jgi:hypothetical protein
MAAITTEQPTTGRRPINWQTVWTVLIGVFWVAILVGIIGGYFFHLNTGFPENGKLWDWIQLLSAPVFVSALPFVFKGPRHQADDKAVAPATQSDQPNQADLHVDEDRKQEASLEAYQDYMLELLLDKNLSSSQPGSDVREVARARTLTALRRVGTHRKGEVLRFLHEAGLIYKGNAIVDLRGADLSGADLSNIKLSGTELSGIDFSNANLNTTLLDGANLKGANLTGASYTAQQLSKAFIQ